jgi:hypothetical protein
MRIISFILFTLFLFSEGQAQDQIEKPVQPVVVYDEESDMKQLELDESTIDELKSDEDFNYEEVEAVDTIWDKFMRWLGEMWDSFWRWLLGDYEASGFLAFFIRLLPYIIIAGIVFFVIWLFYKLNPGARFLKSKEKPEVFFTEEEEIIRSKNIEELIQKALENKNYRLAIRYFYLMVLKKLTDAEIITYEFDKTNSEYVSEITSEEISGQFSKVTTLYDYTWYGSFDVSETDFGIARKSFNTLVQQIPEGNE